MSDHPIRTLALFVPTAGAIHYVRTKSMASLVTCLALGASFAASSFLIRSPVDSDNLDVSMRNAYALSCASSVALMGVSVKRMMTLGMVSGFPAAGVVGGLLGAAFAGKQYMEWKELSDDIDDSEEQKEKL